MIVIPEMVMKSLMQQIVGATQHLTDTAGNRVVLGTIMEPQLRTAVLSAMLIVTGQAVWPEDRPIVIQRPKFSHGIIREEG